VPVLSVIVPQTYSFLFSSPSWEIVANVRVLVEGVVYLLFILVPSFRSLLPSSARLRKLLKRYLTTPIQH
jgi:hypothetical protein